MQTRNPYDIRFRIFGMASWAVLWTGFIWCGAVFTIMCAGTAFHLGGGWGWLLDSSGMDWSAQSRVALDELRHTPVEQFSLSFAVGYIPGVVLVWLGDRGWVWSRRKRGKAEPALLERLGAHSVQRSPAQTN